MADSTQLHNDANQLRQKVKAKRDDAYKATVRAGDFNRVGNFEKAAMENEQANKSNLEAIPMEKTAMGYDRMAAEQDAKAFELQKQQSKIQMDAQTQINNLEQQQKALRGDS